MKFAFATAFGLVIFMLASTSNGFILNLVNNLTSSLLSVDGSLSASTNSLLYANIDNLVNGLVKLTLNGELSGSLTAETISLNQLLDIVNQLDLTNIDVLSKLDLNQIKGLTSKLNLLEQLPVDLLSCQELIPELRSLLTTNVLNNALLDKDILGLTATVLSLLKINKCL